jgi:cell division protein FtsW
MVYSASSVMAKLRYQSETHFALQQGIALAISLVVMLLLKRTHYRKLQTPAVAFAAVGLVVFMLVTVYIVDTRQHRWLRLGGLNLQPAELAKPAIVVFLAYFVAQRARAINDKHTVRPALMAVGLVTAAIGIADLGTALVVGMTAAAVFYVAGLERRYFAYMLLIGLAFGSFFVISKPYRLARVVQFIDPDYKKMDRIDPGGAIKGYLRRSMAARDTNYQMEQSKIAVGAGGPLGAGLMEGKQKLFYLPEAHTDFIYAVICEELGLLGSLGVLGVFCLILYRGLRATLAAADDFARYLALGITTIVVVQAFMNISVVLALGPTKGIPLPMISYGGNALLSMMAMMGMLMNVSENAG